MVAFQVKLLGMEISFYEDVFFTRTEKNFFVILKLVFFAIICPSHRTLELLNNKKKKTMICQLHCKFHC